MSKKVNQRLFRPLLNTDNIEQEVLPEVTSDDNGKILKVVDGEWDKAEASGGLPKVTTVDNGKLLKVVSGEWSKSGFPQYKISNFDVVEVRNIANGSATIGAGQSSNKTGDAISGVTGDLTAMVIGVIINCQNPKIYYQGRAYIYSTNDQYPATTNNKIKYDITLTNTSDQSADIDYDIAVVMIRTKNVYADVVS